jgi:hypothetical protein
VRFIDLDCEIVGELDCEDFFGFFLKKYFFVFFLGFSCRRTIRLLGRIN